MNIKNCIVSLLLCSSSLVFAGITEDVVSARQAVSNDFTAISKWFTNELTEGLAFNAGSGRILAADVIEFPGFGFGVSAGASIWPIDAGKFQNLGLTIIDTSSANKIDMPDMIGMANAFGHIRAGLPFDIDMGARYGGFSFESNEGDAAIDIENAIWGIEVRKRLLGGTWTNMFLPDVALSVSFDNASGKIERTESYSDANSVVYEDTTYTQEIESTSVWATKWNVQNVGVKALVSKTFLFVTPLIGIGINKHMGDTKTKINTSGTISLESSIFSYAIPLAEVSKTEIDADDSTFRLITGLELKLFMLRVGLSGEFSGDYKAYHAGLRLQFR